MCIEDSTSIKIRNSFAIQRKDLLIYILNETNCFECIFIENIKIRIVSLWEMGPFKNCRFSIL